jgi:hypothetical protein
MALKGDVTKIDFNNYTYTNIVNGNFKAPNYKGEISINDPNLTMNFDGLLDLTNKENKYDFHINVENADLNQLNLVKDSVSILREMLLCRFQEIPLKIYKETLTLRNLLSK